jgi:hypothetical protein
MSIDISLPLKFELYVLETEIGKRNHKNKRFY